MTEYPHKYLLGYRQRDCGLEFTNWLILYKCLLGSDAGPRAVWLIDFVLALAPNDYTTPLFPDPFSEITGQQWVYLTDEAALLERLSNPF